MSLKRTALATAVAGAIGISATAAVHATALDSLVITGGTFAMGVFTPAPNTITNFSGANLIGPAIPPAFDTTVGQAGPDGGSPISWDFNLGGVWVNSFTTGSSSGDATGGNISGTINLTDNWNGTNFAQGGAFSGTASGPGGTDENGTFSASWTSSIVGGPFNGQTGTYNVTGTYSTVVPVPAAAWLFGSGLVGLVGVARRRRAAKSA